VIARNAEAQHAFFLDRNERREIAVRPLSLAGSRFCYGARFLSGHLTIARPPHQRRERAPTIDRSSFSLLLKEVKIAVAELSDTTNKFVKVGRITAQRSKVQPSDLFF
jgi:hypothetical protein